MKKYRFVLLISNNIHYHKILFIFNYYIINRYNLYITIIVYFKVIITWVLNEDFWNVTQLKIIFTISRIFSIQ